MAAPEQLTREHLAVMTPTQIVQARAEGKLDRLLGASDEEIAFRALARDPEARLTADQAVAMSRAGLHQAVAQANREGRIDFTPTEENL